MLYLSMKQNILKYRGYTTVIEFSAEDQMLYGKIEDIRDLVNFLGENAAEIEQAFHEAVDDYLDFCKDVGKEPEKPYKGSFNVRIPSELHRAAVIKAREAGLTLNGFVETALREKVERVSPDH